MTGTENSNIFGNMKRFKRSARHIVSGETVLFTGTDGSPGYVARGHAADYEIAGESAS